MFPSLDADETASFIASFALSSQSAVSLSTRVALLLFLPQIIIQLVLNG
jgi:hypothetical protein